MPVLKIETNQTLSREQTTALMEKSTDMLCRVLGKDKTYMMVYVDAGCSMMFNGSAEPFAYMATSSVIASAGFCMEKVRGNVSVISIAPVSPGIAPTITPSTTPSTTRQNGHGVAR